MKKDISLILLVSLLGVTSALLFTKGYVEKQAKVFPQNLEQFFDLEAPHLEPGQSTNKTVHQNLTAGNSRSHVHEDNTYFCVCYFQIKPDDINW